MKRSVAKTALGAKAFAAITAVEGLKLSAESKKAADAHGGQRPDQRRTPSRNFARLQGCALIVTAGQGYDAFDEPYCYKDSFILKNRAELVEA